MKAQDQDDISSAVIRKAIKEGSQRAVDEVFALGGEVTILEDGKLIAINKDGHRRVIKEMAAPQ